MVAAVWALGERKARTKRRRYEASSAMDSRRSMRF
jgi:hypothetical protein